GWAAPAPTIATVSDGGVVSTTGAGDATVTATLDGATASAQVQVVRNGVASVTISPGNSSVFPGQTQQLSGVALDASGRPVLDKNIKWTTSDPSIARVDTAGQVTGVAKGVGIITAQIQGKKASATVNVLAVPVATVSVTLAKSELAVGQSTQGSTVLTDLQGNILTGRVVAWQSSNPAIATVNASGFVVAVANGSVTISAISEG